MSECQTKAGNQEFCKTCKLALSHSLTLDTLNNFCFHVYAQKSLSLFLNLTLFQSLIHSLSTCWTSFVFMCKLKSKYLKLCNMSHVACHMSYVKCLFRSLVHAEQLLFSCLCSNVTLYTWKYQCFFFTTTQLLQLSDDLIIEMTVFSL